MTACTQSLGSWLWDSQPWSVRSVKGEIKAQCSSQSSVMVQAGLGWAHYSRNQHWWFWGPMAGPRPQGRHCYFINLGLK